MQKIKSRYGNIELVSWIYSTNALGIEAFLHHIFKKYSTQSRLTMILNNAKTIFDLKNYEKYGVFPISQEFFYFKPQKVHIVQNYLGIGFTRTELDLIRTKYLNQWGELV